jgi:uncharacterized membrane protein
VKGKQQRFEDSLCALLLLVSFVYCLAASVLGGPFQLQADEGRRWVRAYALSEGEFFTEQRGSAKALASLNINAFKFERELLGPIEQGGEITWQEATEASRRLSALAYRDGKVNVASEVVVPALLYLPGAAGILAGKILGFEFLFQLHLGRLASAGLIFALLLGICRLAGRHRLPVVAGLLLPATVGFYPALEHSTFATLVPVAVLLGFWRMSKSEEPATPATLAALTGLFLLLCLAKPPYFAFALCALIIPSARFGGIWRKLLTLSLCGLPALAFQVLWSLATRLDFMEYFQRGKAQAAEQAANLLADPLGVLETIGHTLATNDPGTVASGLVPYLPPPHPLTDVMWLGLIPLALLLAASALRPRPPAPERKRPLALLVPLSTLLCVLLFYLGFYLNYTLPGDSRIEGVAFRYFLPFGPIFALMLGETLPQRVAAPRLSALFFAGFALSAWLVLAMGFWAQTAWLRL